MPVWEVAMNNLLIYFINCLPIFFMLALEMASTQAVTDIGCDELKKFQKDSTATIVDVRGLDEIQETGKLPGSVNIPCMH